MHLRIFGIFICIVTFFTSCAHEFNGAGSEKQIPGIAITKQQKFSQHQPANHRLHAAIGIVSLLFIWLLYRQIHRIQRQKKGASLDETDLALLGLSADTLNNLWRRLQKKSKTKIIPFNRRG